ncbi:hypothetical protein QFZ51_003529 [Chitinophaga sp. W3I9]
MFYFDDAMVSINCPCCDYGLDVELREVRLGSRVICHNCKQIIQLQDGDASVHTGLQDITQALNDLFRNFK